MNFYLNLDLNKITNIDYLLYSFTIERLESCRGVESEPYLKSNVKTVIVRLNNSVFVKFFLPIL